MEQSRQTFYYRETNGGWIARTQLGTDPLDEGAPGPIGSSWWIGVLSWGLPSVFAVFLVSVPIALDRQGNKAREMM